jgi:hypothetical protein
LSDVFENEVGAIMVDRADFREIAKRAEELYEARWRAELERDHLPEFAAIEPESATYFLGKSLSDASRDGRVDRRAPRLGELDDVNTNKRRPPQSENAARRSTTRDSDALRLH